MGSNLRRWSERGNFHCSVGILESYRLLHRLKPVLLKTVRITGAFAYGRLTAEQAGDVRQVRASSFCRIWRGLQVLRLLSVFFC